MRVLIRLLPARLLLGLALVLSTGAALGSGTPAIPPNAASGRVSATTVSTIEIDGRTLRLAPGARIYSQSNRTVTPNMVAPGSAVRYVADESGQVRTVWIVAGTQPLPNAPRKRP